MSHDTPTGFPQRPQATPSRNALPPIRRMLALLASTALLVIQAHASAQDSPSSEIREAIESMVQPSNQPRPAPSQIIETLISKHGRGTVADLALDPLIAALNGTNYQTRESVTWALRELKEPRAAGPLVEFLHVENLGDRGAEQALVALGEPAVGPLVAATQGVTTNRHFLHKAVRTLGELKDPRGVSSVLRIFALDDNSFSWLCAEALAQIGGPEAVDGLIATLKSGSLGLKINSAKALGRLKDRQAVPPLIAALQEQDRGLRGEAARALGEIGDPTAIDSLITALIDPKLNAAGEASEALGKMRGAGATEALLRRFREARGSAERASLLPALSRLGEPAVAVMIEIVQDADPEVRHTALRNLSAMSSPGMVVAQGISEPAQRQAREAILAAYEQGRADDLPYPERISILVAIKEARATRLILRTLKSKEVGYEDCPWYVPQDIYLAFEKAGPYAVEPLMESLADADPSVRAGAAAMLGHLPLEFHGSASEVQASTARIIDRLTQVANDAKEHEAAREKALWSLSRLGNSRHAPAVLAVLNDRAAPVPVRRAAARAFVGERLHDPNLAARLLPVFRDKSVPPFVRVETAAALQALEHKYHDPQIVEAFKAIRTDRSEPAALRAASRTTQQLLERVRAQSSGLSASSRGGQGGSTPELPQGKKPWPKSTAKSRSGFLDRTLVESKAEGTRQEIKAWYDSQFADWKVHKDWSAREIAVMMNGEWKAWSKQNLVALVVVHEAERRGGMTVLHAFDREEDIQDFLAEIPDDVAHREKCKRNLQAIESAKNAAIRKFRLATGGSVDASQLSELIPGGYGSLECPDAGTYAVGVLGKPARCTAHGTTMAIGRR